MKSKSNNKKKIMVNIAHSFKEADDWDIKYYAFRTPEERLSDIQFCREQYYLINPKTTSKNTKNVSRKRLPRVLKIVKQTPS